MSPPTDQRPRGSRATMRMDARLDSPTRAKVDDLARRFHRPRAVIVCHIMQWGLREERTAQLDQGGREGPVRHLYLHVEVDLHEHVQQAVAAIGVDIAPWLRHMVRQVTITDFPKSWQEERSEERSHESRTYRKRFMLRLDALTGEKIEGLSTHFYKPAAEIIRQLLAQAKVEDFPKSWHMRAAERRAQEARRNEMGGKRELRP